MWIFFYFNFEVTLSFGDRIVHISTNLILEKNVQEDILEKDSNGNNAPDARLLLLKRVNP